MRNIIAFILLSFMMLQFMSGCGAGGNVSSDCDTVAFVAQKNSDSISFPISKGGTGVAKAKVVLMVPSQYRDTAETAKLQHMLAAWLTSSDTIVSDGNLATMCVAMLLSRFDTGEVYEIDDVNSDFEVLDNDRLSVDMNVDVAPCFNAQSLLSMCRTSTTRYNNEEPSTEHTFYNVNLATMKRITLDDIFREEALPALNNLLKQQLVAGAGAKDVNDMLELGYFNLDNLTANNNFKITPEGLTWVYLPLEIACFRVGETQISLSYDELADFFVATNNPLNSITHATDR